MNQLRAHTEPIRTTTIYRLGDTRYTLWFQRETGAPGFSHRVRIADETRHVIVASDWLGANHRPGPKTARYYFEKHAAKLTD